MCDSDTWDGPAYRCQICMQLFSSEANNKMTPLVVCTNIHTVCRGCSTSIRETATPKCPQCRTDLWKHDVVNRDLIYFMNKLFLKCGGCSSNIKMSCSTAFKHSRECLENHVSCPLLNNDPSLSRCNQNMSISNLWQHCIQYHSDNSQTTAVINATETTSSHDLTATLCVSIALDLNSYTFFQIQTKYNTYNMCMHITKVFNSECASDDVVFCLRRFFPEVSLSFGKILISIEVGDVYGMLLPVPSVVSAYESMHSLKDLPPAERLYKLVYVPCDLLKQMGMDFTSQGQIGSSNTDMKVSIQFFFSESSEEQDREEEAAQTPKRQKSSSSFLA